MIVGTCKNKTSEIDVPTMRCPTYRIQITFTRQNGLIKIIEQLNIIL